MEVQKTYNTFQSGLKIQHKIPNKVNNFDAMNKPKNIVIFASGAGSNAEKIISYFKEHPLARVRTVFSNKQDAKVLDKAASMGIETIVFSREDLNQPQNIIAELKKRETDLIVLAGFLWLLPVNLIREYQGKIINIHPSLLPKYGGKGMYGNNVHKAVLENREAKSGITIHKVDDIFDNGEIIFQATCEIEKEEDLISLSRKIHDLEYKYYPLIIEKLLEGHD